MDRNEYIQAGTGILNLSLSARRAWIEMRKYHTADREWAVALRKESVDRNILLILLITLLIMSLSARRAWIEMYK